MEAISKIFTKTYGIIKEWFKPSNNSIKIAMIKREWWLLNKNKRITDKDINNMVTYEQYEKWRKNILDKRLP